MAVRASSGLPGRRVHCLVVGSYAAPSATSRSSRKPVAPPHTSISLPSHTAADPARPTIGAAGRTVHRSFASAAAVEGPVVGYGDGIAITSAGTDRSAARVASGTARPTAAAIATAPTATDRMRFRRDFALRTRSATSTLAGL